MQRIDCQVLCGARSVEDESRAIATGHSKLTDPYQSTHVIGPKRPKALGVDAAPYPVIWPKETMSRQEYAETVGRFYYFAGVVLTRATALGLTVRWGGDWDRDHDFSDQTFDDLVHFELVA